MSADVHPARAPQAAPTAAQQRATFHLLPVQQILYLRFGPKDSLEDDFGDYLYIFVVKPMYI